MLMSCAAVYNLCITLEWQASSYSGSFKTKSLDKFKYPMNANMLLRKSRCTNLCHSFKCIDCNFVFRWR